jgi:hypothetical protein
MAQKQIDLFKKKQLNMSTQTGDDEDFFRIHLDGKKTARIYYSTAYKDNVLSLNFGSSKSFIFTKPMWRLFRNYINTIDNYMKND